MTDGNTTAYERITGPGPLQWDFPILNAILGDRAAAEQADLGDPSDAAHQGLRIRGGGHALPPAGQHVY